MPERWRSTATSCASAAKRPAFAGGEKRIDGSVIGASALLLRFPSAEPSDERLLLVNLGADLPLGSVPDPLFAPPAGTDWQVAWSSEHPDYGGSGQREIDTGLRFILPADCALLLAPGARNAHPVPDKDELERWQRSIG